MRVSCENVLHAGCWPGYIQLDPNVVQHSSKLEQRSINNSARNDRAVCVILTLPELDVDPS